MNIKWIVVKFIVFVVASLVFSVVWNIGVAYFEPDISTEIAVRQVDSENQAEAHKEMRAYIGIQRIIYNLPFMFSSFLFTVLFLGDIIYLVKKWRSQLLKTTSSTVLIFIALSLSGCFMIRPYEKPVYEEIGTNQTAYVVPLDGDFMKQGKLDSEKAYEEFKVTAKRIQISRRWVKTGYLPRSGGYIPTVLVIAVDRSPVTSLWDVSSVNGTIVKDQAIWLESQDSVGFSVPFNCTAYIDEKDTSMFLYYYPYSREIVGSNSEKKGDFSLKDILDGEIRLMVQVIASEYCNRDILDNLRSDKVGLNEAVREAVISFYKNRGITITNLGIAGDYFYENTAVQDSIDAVFIAQQQENEEQAKLDAIKDKIDRMRREGISEANQIQEEAIGQADAIRAEAQGQADAIKAEAAGTATKIQAMALACEGVTEDSPFIEVKKSEVARLWNKKWKGGVSQTMLSEKTAVLPMLPLTTPAMPKNSNLAVDPVSEAIPLVNGN
jgi:hypothetical protein